MKHVRLVGTMLVMVVMGCETAPPEYDPTPIEACDPCVEAGVSCGHRGDGTCVVNAVDERDGGFGLLCISSDGVIVVCDEEVGP